MTRNHIRPFLVHTLPAIGLVAALSSAAPAQGSLLGWGGHPGVVQEGTFFIDVDGGEFHSVALRSDGTVIAWGESGTHPPSSGVPQGQGFVQVAASSINSAALHSDGTITVWGGDTWGQVSNAPTGSGFTKVDLGNVHGVALRSDGSIVSWGNINSSAVTASPPGTGFIDVCAGVAHSLALRSNGSIVGWGKDNWGQSSNVPTGSGFVALAANWEHSLALHGDGSIHSWGIPSQVVTDVPAGSNYAQIATGGTFGLALKTDGTLTAWGWDGPGGNVSDAPTQGGFTHIAAGEFFSFAISPINLSGAYCFGEGFGSACPCGASSEMGTGCPNSTGGAGVSIIGSGPDTYGSTGFLLVSEGAPSSKPCLVLRGSNQINAGLGIVTGDGLLCVSGQVARSQIFITGNQNGQTFFTNFQGSPFSQWTYGPGVPVNYQLWYRDSANPCTGSGFNFSNAYTVSWNL